jgi:hypothetical protein
MSEATDKAREKLERAPLTYSYPIALNALDYIEALEQGSHHLPDSMFHIVHEAKRKFEEAIK